MITKGKWRIQKEQVEDFAIVIGTDEVYNVCQTNCLTTFKDSITEWENNTKHIVKCVNSHKKLLNTCKEMLEEVKTNLKHFSYNEDIMQELYYFHQKLEQTITEVGKE